MTEIDDLYVRNAWAGIAQMAQSDWSALDERFSEAFDLLRTGKSRSAYETCVWLLERDQTFSPALRIAALALIDMGEIKRARAVVDRLAGLDPADWRNRITEAWVLKVERKRKAAVALALDALHLAPDNPDVYSAVAMLTSTIGGQAKVAKEVADRALLLEPTAIVPRFVHATLLGHVGDWQAAIDLYEQALEISPNHEYALAALAFAQRADGQLSSSAATYQQLADTTPGSSYLTPEPPPGTPLAMAGCARRLLLLSPISMITLILVVSTKPVMPLLILLVISASMTASPIRRWLAVRWKPVAMARASTKEAWHERNPDLIVGLVVCLTFAVLMLIAIASNPTAP